MCLHFCVPVPVLFFSPLPCFLSMIRVLLCSWPIMKMWLKQLFKDGSPVYLIFTDRRVELSNRPQRNGEQQGLVYQRH